MTDEITRKRIDSGDWDHWLDLEIRGVRIGETGMVRWKLRQDGDEEYDEQYVADILEKMVRVIRNDDPETEDKP